MFEFTVLYLESYLRGSHRTIALAYKKFSKQRIELMSFPGKKWERKVCNAGVDFADRINREFWARDFDMIVTTDLMNLGDLKTLQRAYIQDMPLVMLWHEHQLHWPSEGLRSAGDYNLLMANVTSALTANWNFFESDWSLESFFVKLRDLMSDQIYDLIRKKSSVLYMGVDLRSLDQYRIEKQYETSTIIFSHRLEPDKNPGEFFRALEVLKLENLDFKVIVTGQALGKTPPEVERGIEMLGDRVLHYGYVESYEEFCKLQWKANIAVSTALHEYFGLAVVENLYCQNWPILPNRLTYPSFLPKEYHAEHLYENFDDLVNKLRWAITHVFELKKHDFRDEVAKYDWNIVRDEWDSAFRKVYEDFYRDERTKETGMVKRIREALANGALSKKQLFRKIGWGGGEYWSSTRRRALINGVSFKYVSDKPVYYLKEEDLNELLLCNDQSGESKIFIAGKESDVRVRQITTEEKQFLKDCVPGIRIQTIKENESVTSFEEANEEAIQKLFEEEEN